MRIGNLYGPDATFLGVPAGRFPLARCVVLVVVYGPLEHQHTPGISGTDHQPGDVGVLGALRGVPGRPDVAHVTRLDPPCHAGAGITVDEHVITEI